MASPIKFGTDGWRAVIAEDFTFDNVRVCTPAVAAYLGRSAGPGARIVVGYDTRFASEDFAAAVAEVLAANGVHVYLSTTAVPTPVVSHAVVDLKANGGVVITASHNPAQWNGFKYKGPDGSSGAVEVIAEIECEIAALTEQAGAPPIKRLALEDAVRQGLVEMYDPLPSYLDQLRRLVDVEAIRSMQGTVVIDSMFGVGAGLFQRILGGKTVQVDELNGERNPAFPGIRPEPIGPNLEKLCRHVPAVGASVGIATDGDADRLGIVDEEGHFLNQHQVFALLCLYLLEVRGERGHIIRSVTTTEMISTLGRIFDVPVIVTAVGFKYVAPLMLEHDAMVGGEESGGYGFRGHIPERDGILAGLYFLDMVRQTGKTPSALLAHLYEMVGTHHYDRLDIELSAQDHSRISDALTGLNPSTLGEARVQQVDRTDGIRLVLQDGAWVLFRLSGTEPLLRIYAEAESPERVQHLIADAGSLLGVSRG